MAIRLSLRSHIANSLVAALAVGCADSSASAPADAGGTTSLPGDGATSPFDTGVYVPNSEFDDDAGVERLDSGTSLRDASFPDLSDASFDASGLFNDAGAGSANVVLVDGKTVTIYRPKGADAKTPLPVVFSLHGLSIPAIAMADVTGLPALADAEGFVAIFPDGSGGTWNTGGSVCGLGSFVGGGSDDVAYMQNILKEVEKTQAVDHAHVFMSGFSMGGYGTNNLACLRPDLFRAAAPASGGFPTEACAPAPIPVMVFHGTSDGTIDYTCGKGARDAWVAHNHCSTDVDSVAVMGGTCEWSRGCPEHGQVVLCSFQGMGHGWAGSVDPFAFGGPQFESATSLMWKFFKQQF